MPLSHCHTFERPNGRLCRRAATIVLLGLGASVTDAVAQTEVERVFGTPAAVAARQDSLERVAITSTDPNQRSSAIIRISAPGRAWYHVQGKDTTDPTVTYPGIVAGLKRVYDAVGPRDREVVVSLLSLQAERGEAVAFLTEVATRNTEMGEVAPLALVAVSALSRMGSEGAAALRQIHSTGDHATWLTRHLEDLARTGYRRPPGG